MLAGCRTLTSDTIQIGVLYVTCLLTRTRTCPQRSARGRRLSRGPRAYRALTAMVVICIDHSVDCVASHPFHDRFTFRHVVFLVYSARFRVPHASPAHRASRATPSSMWGSGWGVVMSTCSVRLPIARHRNRLCLRTRSATRCPWLPVPTLPVLPVPYRLGSQFQPWYPIGALPVLPVPYRCPDSLHR